MAIDCEGDGEVALVRNEARDAILLGIDMRPGDEILMTTHHYGAAKRSGCDT